MGSSFAANLALMYLLVSLAGLWYLAASVIVTVLLLATNFLVNEQRAASSSRLDAPLPPPYVVAETRSDEGLPVVVVAVFEDRESVA
jgi:hypothetical protein